jgi:hypothetical protein
MDSHRKKQRRRSFMKGTRLFYLVLALSALIVFPSCDDDDEGDQIGTLSLGLTDASTDDYQAVYVTQ